MNVVNGTRRGERGLRRRLFRHAGFQHLNDARTPFRGGGLVLDIRIYAVQQALCTELRQLAVEVFTGLAEEFIGGIAQAKDGKRGAIQFWRFFREQELVQRHRFFSGFTFTLGRGDNHQQFFRRDLLEFIIPGVDQVHVQFGGQQVVTKRFGHAAGIARLRSRNQGNGRNFNGRCRCPCHSARLLIEHSPEITGDPGKLSGRKIRGGGLKARQLLRVQGKQI